MATKEVNVAITTKDSNGDTLVIYPYTTTSQVEGLDEALTALDNKFALKSHSHSYINKSSTQITSADLNTLKTDGTRYYAGGSNTCTNKPSGVDAFFLEVNRSAGGWYTQTMYASNNNERYFTRNWNGSAWTAWQKIVTATDVSNGYATKTHTHSYAGSSSAGGSATSAVKLDSSAGSTTQPIYFSGGKPVATTYTLGKSVPSNAVFTDTTYSNFVKSGTGAKAGLVPAPSTTAGTSKYLCENGTWKTPSALDLYPVGAIYISMIRTSPASLFGGTWKMLDAQKTLWTTQINYNNLTTRQTISAQLPNIKGQFGYSSPNHVWWGAEECSGAFTATNTVGNIGAAGGMGVQSGKNLVSFSASNSNSTYTDNGIVRPASYEVFMWVRTA